MSTLQSELNENGYPKNPSSTIIAIQRKFFPHLDGFRQRLGDPNGRIGIPVRDYGKWFTLYGRVTAIKEFPDGVVIHFPQILEDSFLKWPNAILWVPNTGTIGILNPQPPSDKEIQAHLDDMSQKHMEDSTMLAYIIEGLFSHQDELPDGTSKDQVGEMTQFKQIELLEQICKKQRLLGNTICGLGEIHRFVREVDKNGFRTADDFETAPITQEHMQNEDRKWLMTQIESLVKNPEVANFGIDTSRCELEVIITVAEEDRNIFTPEVLETLKNELSERIGFLSPVVYLEGNEPEWLAKGAYI